MNRTIGVDCGVAGFLKDNHKRLYSLPFDWVVTYNGVSEIIRNRFISYIPNDQKTISCHTSFMHHSFPHDTEAFHRRIQRFLQLLDNKNDKLIFFRKGHALRHHKEAECLNTNIKNDLHDAEELCDHLMHYYPDLKFEIIVLLICGNCFDKKNVYTSDHQKIVVINMVSNDMDEEAKMFSNIMNNITSLNN